MEVSFAAEIGGLPQNECYVHLESTESKILEQEHDGACIVISHSLVVGMTFHDFQLYVALLSTMFIPITKDYDY